MGLGSYDDVSLAEARDKAKAAREHHKAGRDPIEERNNAVAKALADKQAAAVRSITFRHYAEQWINENQAGWKNAKHRDQWRNTLRDYAYPVIGDLSVADVNTELVLKVLRRFGSPRRKRRPGCVAASRKSWRPLSVSACEQKAKTLRRGATTSIPCCRRNPGCIRPSITRPCPIRTCRPSWHACAPSRVPRRAPWNSPS